MTIRQASPNSQVRRLVDDAKKQRKKRVYYDKYFDVGDLHEAGIVQSEAKSSIERVVLDVNKNEFIHLFGFDQFGSYFDLTLSIVSLFPDVQKPDEESRWRLANVDFVYCNQKTRCKYSYSSECILDYEEKRNSRSSKRHEVNNIYKIGSLSFEIVFPFSISRILINGLLSQTIEHNDNSSSNAKLVPIKMTISTHPTCDKFDYQYVFNKKHTCKVIQNSLDREQNLSATPVADELLALLLENRFDQPLMFQGQLEILNESSTSPQDFIMWGAKVKKISYAKLINWLECEPTRDCLFVWAESGQQIHLSRPHKYTNLIYGMIDNSVDYASPLVDSKLLRQEGGSEREIPFAELDSFRELSTSHKISLRGFKMKDYVIEFNEGASLDKNGPIKAKINGFDAWARRSDENLGQRIKQAQAKLWVLAINDHLMSYNLASERLLGGKGNSLVKLARLTRGELASSEYDTNASGVKVSVPRGVVVSCLAYNLWLNSSPLILKAIHELDCIRRALATRSIYLNPMSDRHLSIVQSQQILTEQCRKTCLVLRSCPLPNVLRKKLFAQLTAMFDETDLKETEPLDDGEDEANDRPAEDRKLFAVRSSAVGEDALETSAAGQMRTILDARGFNHICRAIVECWSSQFEPEAVAYKSQNGLSFNLPMAVVVQELVACQTAGVAATCDPLSGNKSRLEITANLGLGEGVVSGKQTDTIRVSLERLEWDATSEHHQGSLRLEHAADSVNKFIGNNQTNRSCCLDDKKIIALSNLLLKLRRVSSIKEREVEWGITLVNSSKLSPSSSSSSSSSDDSDIHEEFCIHLLQSRPLTHLQRLSTSEIDHELDYGLFGPRDMVSRANVGEVMPGAMCPINSTYFQPLASTFGSQRPFEKAHTRMTFVPETLCFYSHMAMLVLTYSDTIMRFAGSSRKDRELSKAAVYSMIGTTFDDMDSESEEKFERMVSEKINPLSMTKKTNLRKILALDMGLHTACLFDQKRAARSTLLEDNLRSLDELIELFESGQTPDAPGGPWGADTTDTILEIKREIKLLYSRLTTKTKPLSKAWVCHIQSTLMSVAFNVMCLKLMTQQPAYPDDMTSTEVLNDFSVLMRGPSGRSDKLGEQTESGDISKLLNRLLESFIDENQLDKAKAMSQKELYEMLTDEQSKSRCVRLFRDFMSRNGHRAFKEFCFSTRAWSDDSSYIVRLLSVRLKTFGRAELEQERKRMEEVERVHEQRLAQIEAKLARAKFMLTKYALPRARNATIKREESKSLLIRMIHKYRLAFRHLGALLCLAGRLPNAQLVFHLTIEELDTVVKGLDGEEGRTDLARLLYKARRRQQRTHILDKVTFPRPSLSVDEMISSVRQQVAAAGRPASERQVIPGPDGAPPVPADDGHVAPVPRVVGLTSCAGCVTGRACVVMSLDEMDQIETNDILVTYSIDISWSVYFFALAGIVTEVGGIVSHGAVVAREYGIPTLCTAVGACSTFKTGQMITLDADKGVCYLANAISAEHTGEAAKGMLG